MNLTMFSEKQGCPTFGTATFYNTLNCAKLDWWGLCLLCDIDMNYQSKKAASMLRILPPIILQ